MGITQQLLSKLYRSIIVSVQAEEGEPLNRPLCIVAMAQSALNGGAKGLRLANAENIEVVRDAEPSVPIIGITKPAILPADKDSQVYITPSLWAAESVIKAGADIVAMDATLRRRPTGEKLQDIVGTLKERYPDILLMADVSNTTEAQVAASLKFDLISTTLSGYTSETLARGSTNEPDFELLQQLIGLVDIPVVLEGRVWTPEHITQGFKCGAYAVVVGSAITRPQLITQRFVQAIPQAQKA